MAGSDIGYYTLPVIVSFKGIDAQVEDKLGKSIQDLGKKTGEQLGTAVIAGLDPTKSTKVDSAIKGSAGAGKKMGDAITTEVAKNIDGKKVSDAITKGAQPKATGEKIGKEVKEGIDKGMTDAGAGPTKIIKDAVKDFGKELATDIQSGNLKEAFSRVGDVVDNTTTGIKNLGSVVGVNLDNVERLGHDTAKTLDTVGETVQGVVDRVRTTKTDFDNVTTAVRQLGSGDVVSRIKGVSTALDAVNTAASHAGVDISGVTTPVQNVVDTAAGVADTVTTLKSLLAPGARTAATFVEAGGLGSSVAESVTALGGLASAASLAAGPLLAIGGLAAGGKWLFDLSKWDPNKFGAPGTSPALAPEAEIPHLPFQPGLEPLIKPAAPTPRGDFVPAPPPPKPAPGRVAATEIPQPGWTRDPSTGTLYTPDGMAVAATPGEYAHPGPSPSGWGTTGARITAPEIAPASTSGGGWGPGGKGTPLGEHAAAVGTASVSASSATISVGSATISGVSLPAASPGTTAALARPGFKSWYDKGGAVEITAHEGEHVLTRGDVAAMGGQQAVYDFRRHINGPNRAAIKGVGYGGAYDVGGEVKEVAAAIAPEVAKAAAQGAAQGAAAGGMAKPFALGGSPLQQSGAGGGQDTLQFLSGMLGVAGQGAEETLGLGTVFPDPMANPSVKSLFALASAFKGPIEGAMRGKLGIQQPGWRPGMPVAAMANDQGNAGSIGLPFGLPSIDIPAAPAPGPPEAPGGSAAPGGPAGNTYNVDASINYHDGAVLGVDPAAQRAADTRTQERNLAGTVAPTDPGNH